ncbi:Hsp70 family protein [Actinoplanes sp. NPDC026619]|uniref:Hsp70 family protein n=1 Tax=Actinoplanes sp. NPDC026619 TaxID=3155798 RepID=UPI0033D9B3C9
MTDTDGFVLGVDLGTSHTVAMLRHPDGRTRPLLFDGQPLLPSAVYLDTTGRLHVGADALRLGHAEPNRLEPNPKRHIDDGTVLLGDSASVPVADLFAALLGAVAREAVATVGFLPPAILTYPAAWGPTRRTVLTEALGKAGWPAETSLVPEPVAAARYFADVLRRPVPTGSSIAVFDFGGGTLDVAVVRADQPGTFSVTASGGADDLGGLDVDAALVDLLGKSLAGGEPAAWQRLTEPTSLAEWRARRRFWDDVRGAKEMLSRSSFAPVPVPGVEHAVHLTRDELEAAADPLVRRGVAEAGTVIAAAGLKPGDLAGLFLVGGSSRIPLVARLLHSLLGIAPTVLEQPELPVAEGAIIAAGQVAPARFATGTAAAATPTPTPATKADSPPPITDTRADAAAPASAPPAPPVSAPPVSAPPKPADAEEATDERLRAAPVDPWATGEAAALPTAADPIMAPTPSSPASWGPAPSSAAPSSAAPSSAAPSSAWGPVPTPPPWAAPVAPNPHSPEAPARPRRRRRLAWVLTASAVTLVLVAGGVLTWVFWPGYGALDYHALSDPRRIGPIVPVTTDFTDAAIYRDRAYFASSDSTAGGIVGVVAIRLDATKPLWTSKEAGTATRWKSMVATPVGLVLFTDFDSTNDYKWRMAVLGAADGKLLWQRTLTEDDQVFFAGDSAVIADRPGKQLLGLKLATGAQRWSLRDPDSTAYGKTQVLTATTPKDLGGPATVFGRPYQPDLADDPRIVEIGNDKSARVVDANTGKILTDRQNVAQPTDEVIAHNGRLIVLQPDDQRILSYEMDKLGEPKVVYTTQTADSGMKDVTPCGDDRVCFDEVIGSDAKTNSVVALDVDSGQVVWRYKLGNVETIVPVGEAVVASTTSNESTLIDGAGKQVWTRTGEAARLDGGNLLEFSKPLSRSPDDPALSGRHLGDDAVPLGALSDIRSDTCAWNTSTLACVAEKDFVLLTFAG